MKKTVAVLALQGAFEEHCTMLQGLGVDTVLIRSNADWKAFSQRFQNGDSVGLIIPGGESTAMLRIMNDEELLLPIRNAILSGLPVFGTCAGMILLANSVVNDSRERLATMDIKVLRNAYGRQLGSFYTEEVVCGIADHDPLPMTFIRAPYITEVSQSVSVLATVDGKIVAAQQGKQLVCSFHPELNADTRFHKYFLDMIS